MQAGRGGQSLRTRERARKSGRGPVRERPSHIITRVTHIQEYEDLLVMAVRPQLMLVMSVSIKWRSAD